MVRVVAEAVIAAGQASLMLTRAMGLAGAGVVRQRVPVLA